MVKVTLKKLSYLEIISHKYNSCKIYFSWFNYKLWRNANKGKTTLDLRVGC